MIVSAYAFRFPRYSVSARLTTSAAETPRRFRSASMAFIILRSISAIRRTVFMPHPSAMAALLFSLVGALGFWSAILHLKLKAAEQNIGMIRKGLREINSDFSGGNRSIKDVLIHGVSKSVGPNPKKRGFWS